MPENAEVEQPTTKRIYVASSWRNMMQQGVVYTLRAAGFEVYDFKNPEPGDDGFAWSEIDPDWIGWTPEGYLAKIDHPRAQEGYGKDLAAMEWADTFVLVLPCGRSAHLELGWAVGMGKRTCILLAEDGFEPELMYRMVDHMSPDVLDLLDWVGVSDD